MGSEMLRLENSNNRIEEEEKEEEKEEEEGRKEGNFNKHLSFKPAKT